jgi:hypothetical protein
LRSAANIAGLDVVRAVNEATATSLAYRLDLDDGDASVALVYNLDGTAFDATVIEIDEGVFEILSAVVSENISRNGLDVDSSHLAHLLYDSRASPTVSKGREVHMSRSYPRSVNALTLSKY